MLKILQMTVLVFIVAVFLSACAGPQGVKSGSTVDYIGSVEQRNNGSYFIWAWNDTSNAYCTFDAALANQASDLLFSHKMAVIAYNGINAGDKDANNFFDAGCEHKEGVQVLRLTSIAGVAPGLTPASASKP